MANQPDQLHPLLALALLATGLLIFLARHWPQRREPVTGYCEQHMRPHTSTRLARH